MPPRPLPARPGADDPGIEIPHTHRDVTGGWLRPAVFGVTDGLVSNSALVAAVAGGGLAPREVALAGLGGLVAGAFSMASGEYVSVASQAELTQAEIAVEDLELRRHPAAEQAELAGIYRRRGLDPALADEVARQLSRDHATTLRVHAREELGVDPDDLPSPWTAAGSSFAAFAVGALVPALPYLLGGGSLLLALVLTAVALFLSGALISRFTSRGAVYSGTRLVLVGAVSGAVAHLVGQAFGAVVG